MKGSTLGMVAVVFLAILGMAMIWDSQRAVSSAKAEVTAADNEVKMHEERLANLLDGYPAASIELKNGIATFRAANDRIVRQAAFQFLASEGQKILLGNVDATNPAQRRYADELLGAINRRDIAKRVLDEKLRECEALKGGFRWSLAETFGAEAPSC